MSNQPQTAHLLRALRKDANVAKAGADNAIADLAIRSVPESHRKTLELLPQPLEFAAYHLAAIVESADDAIVSKTLDGIIRSWNRGAERIFGYTADEVIGKPVLILIPTERQSEEDDILARIRAGERVEHFETVRRRKDGALIDISLTVSPIKGTDGQIIGASKIARDITLLKRSAEQLRASEERYRTSLQFDRPGFLRP
jgi:PAS domain S-box-containing protein